MNTCKECLHWKNAEERDGIRIGQCESPKAYPKNAVPSNEGIGQEGMDAGYVDITFGQDFGCIHFEKKPE